MASEPVLIAAALVVVYLILGVLYESVVHPITILSTLPSAGLGALLMLMVFHYDLSVIALIGIILLIGIVKKNAIMLIDFALDAERNHGMTPEAVDLPGLRPALPPDHDDDDGGAARRRAADARHRHRIGDPPAARLQHRRRSPAVAAADPLHDAGGLSLSRPGELLAPSRPLGPRTAAVPQGEVSIGQ